MYNFSIIISYIASFEAKSLALPTVLLCLCVLLSMVVLPVQLSTRKARNELDRRKRLIVFTNSMSSPHINENTWKQILAL